MCRLKSRSFQDCCCFVLCFVSAELLLVKLGSDPGVGDDGGRGDADRLGGPRISPPRFPMS